MFTRSVHYQCQQYRTTYSIFYFPIFSKTYMYDRCNCIWGCRRDPHFNPKFLFRCVSFSQMANKFCSKAWITFFRCQADFKFVPFQRPSFSKFIIVEVATSYTLQFITTRGQPEVHPWAMHEYFSQYLVPDPLSPTTYMYLPWCDVAVASGHTLLKPKRH